MPRTGTARLGFLLTLSLLLVGPASVQAAVTPGPTLGKVRADGALACAVDFEEAEYTTEDAHGNHSAFDLGLCKAIAVAVLGENAKFNIIPFRDEQDALKGLKAGEAAVLATGTVNFFNTTEGSLGFTRPIFYDSQAFMVNSASNLHVAKDLAGKRICFLGGTEYEMQLNAYMARNHLKFLPFPFEEEGEMEAAFITHNCDAVTADLSQLGFERIAFHNMAAKFVILPDVIADDPLAPAYRLGDPQWAAIVNWVTQALLLAEQSGITQANVQAMRNSDDLAVERLLGTLHGYGQSLGLDDDWAVRVIAAVGNYGELFNRTLGPTSVMRLERGQNQLASHGGLLLADPIR